MRRITWYLTFTVCLLLINAPICHLSVASAHISSLKLGKEKDVRQESDHFGQNDTIHALAAISDVQGSVKVTARLVVEDVAGVQSGPIKGLESTVELPKSGQAHFEFSAPTKGWPKGTYHVEVVVVNAHGEQEDEGTAEFTVS